MEGKYYTSERNVQIVIYLLKAYGIRKVIASPGTTNMTLVASLQQDPFFEIYSSVDERSAAYIACGMAAESGEPVVLTCTGATASRNYYPGLTEAYYRKLPVIAITSTQDPARIGQLAEQVVDRSQHARDVVVLSEHLQYVEAASDEWNVTIKANRLMHTLRRHGGGPVHINLETRYSRDFSVKQLPEARLIRYVSMSEDLPELPKGKIGIMIGSHRPMSQSLTDALDKFCEAYRAVVFCSHTSNYKGDFGVSNSLVAVQDNYRSELMSVNLLITIGEISGGDSQMRRIQSKEQWRLSEDGEIRDLFHGLTCVFEMPEERFFSYYAQQQCSDGSGNEWLSALHEEYKHVLEQLPELPFSNLWVAQQTLPQMPKNAVLHLGILNTIRCWNFFQLDKSVTCFANTGGFGIDGNVSSLIGASLANPDKLCFGVVGDLAFFYDLNSMGNRHVGSNVRIMLINNGRGVEFRNPYHVCYAFGEEADPYMAAAGHFGNQSRDLIRHYATDLGYEYLSASTKDEFSATIAHFLDARPLERPIIFEVFTSVEGEQSALWSAHHILSSPTYVAKERAKGMLKSVVGQKGVAAVKKVLGK